MVDAREFAKFVEIVKELPAHSKREGGGESVYSERPDGERISLAPPKPAWTLAVALRRPMKKDFERRTPAQRLAWKANAHLNTYVHADLLVRIPCRGPRHCCYWIEEGDNDNDDDDPVEEEKATSAGLHRPLLSSCEWRDDESRIDADGVYHDETRGHVLCATFTNLEYTYRLDRVFASKSANSPEEFEELIQSFDFFAVSDSPEVAKKAHDFCSAQASASYNHAVLCTAFSSWISCMRDVGTPGIPTDRIIAASKLYDREIKRFGQAFCPIQGSAFHCSQFVGNALVFALWERFRAFDVTTASPLVLRKMVEKHGTKIQMDAVCDTS